MEFDPMCPEHWAIVNHIHAGERASRTYAAFMEWFGVHLALASWGWPMGLPHPPAIGPWQVQ